jgi:transcriptional regulator with XRE-family HTH domain
MDVQASNFSSRTSMDRERRIINARIGSRISVRRIEMGLSQTEVGEACGVSFQQVQKYELGTNSPSVVRLMKIAQRLDVPFSYFFQSSDPAIASDSLIAGAISNRERLEAMKAFGDIGHRRVRKTLSDLMRALASDRDG